MNAFSISLIVGGTVAQSEDLRLTARRSWVRFPPGEAVGAGGVSHTLRRRCPHPKRGGRQKGLSVRSLHVLPVSPWVRTTCPHKNMQRVKAKMGYKNVGKKHLKKKKEKQFTIQRLWVVV